MQRRLFLKILIDFLVPKNTPRDPHKSRQSFLPNWKHEKPIFWELFLRIGKNVRLVMHSYLFSPDLSIEFSRLAKTAYVERGPVCAMASKSYDRYLRNKAKISSKMAKNQPFLDFSIFSKTLYTIPTKISPVIFHHISPMCAIKIV